MTSTEHCVNFIHQHSGLRPILLSFYKSNSRANNDYPVSRKPCRVPNIIHLIRFGEEEPLRFYNSVDFKSCHKYLSPLAIFLWADHIPIATISGGGRHCKKLQISSLLYKYNRSPGSPDVTVSLIHCSSVRLHENPGSNSSKVDINLENKL